MITEIYSEPVSKLLTYKALEAGKALELPDYHALGIGPEHIPDLIRMATDKQLQSEDASDEEFSAPTYAIHALGEFHAEEAIEPLLSYLENVLENEWFTEELPKVLSKIGAAAVPALATYITDSHDIYALGCAGNALETIATDHSEVRTQCIEAIVRRLELYNENDDELNAFLIGNLAPLKATEALPLIEQVFKADKVDQMVINIEDVLVDIGLKERDPQVPPTIHSMINIIKELNQQEDNEEEPRTFEGVLENLKSHSAMIEQVERPSKPFDPSSVHIVTPNERYWRTPTGPTKENKQKNKTKMAKASRNKNKRKH